MLKAKSRVAQSQDFFFFARYLDNFATLGSEFVDLGLGDVGSLLSLLHLMLHLPKPGQVSVGLLLLCDKTMVESNPFLLSCPSWCALR